MMLNDYEKINEAQSKKALIQYNNLALAYKHAFKSSNGELVLSDLTRSFNGAPSYMPGGNVKDACYYEGQKSVISHIYTLINYKPKEE